MSAVASLARICLHSPFTPSTLSHIRTLLPQPEQPPLSSVNPDSEQPAAVVIPLCNIQGAPSILFEVRGDTREHAREISFPGGGIDMIESPLAAALRETEEELGIPRTSIEVLGTVTPPVRSISGKCVWPFVGWIHPTEPADLQAQQPSAPPRCYDSVTTPCTICRSRELFVENQDSRSQYFKPTDGPLRSLNLSALSICEREVRNIFYLRLSSLSETVPSRTLINNATDFPSRNLALKTSLFRSVPSKPYYVVNRVALGCDVDKDATRAEREIWGLTGWYLNLFMRTMGWWGEPPREDV